MVSANDLLARKAVAMVRDVPIDGVGTIRVRALSQDEVTAIREANASKHTLENRLVAAAMVDPKLTALEVDQWLSNAPAGDAVAVKRAIVELSGLDVTKGA